MGVDNSREHDPESMKRIQDLFASCKQEKLSNKFSKQEDKPMSNEEFSKQFWEYFKDHEQLGIEWEAGAFYNKDGDMIEWYIERVSYYADRVNEIITLYRAEDDDRVIGGCIKNIDYLLGKREKPSGRMD